jgi:23S rRNA maturation mini-RNase III
MADNILKEYIDDAVEFATNNTNAEYAKEGEAIVERLLREPALLMEVVSKIRNIPDAAAEIVERDGQLKAMNESLNCLREVRAGYVKQIKKEKQDCLSKENSRKLIKQADEAMDDLSKIKSKVVIGLLDKRLDDVIESVLKDGTSPRVKLSERKVNVGGKEYSYRDYLKQLRSYQYKFYSLSNDAEEVKLEYYRLLAESDSIIDHMDKLVRRSGSVDFTFKLNPVMPLQFSLDDINEFAENLKLIATLASKMVDRKDISCFNADFIKNESGDNFFNTTFDMWDRCLRIYELNREKGYAIEKNMTAKIDSIGKTVSKEFNWYEKSATTDRRKAVKADYDCAVKLIARAVKGSLLA